MTENFYNTTNLSGSDLAISKKKANTQTERIKDFFYKNPFKEFTPFEVMKALNLEKVPITSIRRAMTNLTYIDEPFLEITDIQRQGDYGKPNCTWKLAVPKLKVPEQRSLFE